VEGSANLEPMNVQLVSGTYFFVLGVQPALGRAFSKSDDEPLGAHAVAVISNSWWTRRFGGDTTVIGKAIALGPRLYTIIGVAPREFFGTTVGESPDVWVPLSMEKEVSPGWNGLEDRWWDSLYILGRVKPGLPVSQAEASINVLAKAIWRDFAGPVIPSHRQENIDHAWIPLTPASRGLSHLRFQYSLPLQILMVVVALVLLIACANIANLLLARSANRRREIAVLAPSIAYGRPAARLSWRGVRIFVRFLGQPGDPGIDLCRPGTAAAGHRARCASACVYFSGLACHCASLRHATGIALYPR
jgi:hypothetical protein